MVIELMMSSNHLILCCPLLLSSIFPSIRMMGNHLMSQLFASGALSIVLLKVTQSIELFNSASLLLVNIQGWFLLGLTDLISLQSKGLSRVFSNTTVQKHVTPQFKSMNSSVLSFLYSPTRTSIHDYWKTIALTIQTFVCKVMPLLLNILSRFVIAFLPRSRCLLISWLKSPSTVILGPRK